MRLIFLILTSVVFFSKSAYAGSDRFLCIAFAVNGDPVSERTAIAQGGVYLPTIRVNSIKAEIFTQPGGMVLNLGSPTDLVLRYNDMINDPIAETFRAKEYDRYRTEHSSGLFDLLILKKNGDYFIKDSGLYSMILFLNTSDASVVFNYDCYDEVTLFNKLDISISDF